MNSERFDLIAKYLYIKYDNKYYKDLYIAHIKTFNKLWEDDGKKNGKEDFIKSFDKLIVSLKKNGYNNDYPIEMGNNGVIINGAHRLAICHYLNIEPTIKIIDAPGNVDYTYHYFLNRNMYSPDNSYEVLSREYTDTMALEYTKLNKNIRSMIIYPVAYCDISILMNIINKYTTLYYHKTIDLNPNGVKNLIKEMYRGEEWIGGMFPPDICGGKYQRCVANRPTQLLLIEFKENTNFINFKEECRMLFNLGKHSLHISDDEKDTFRITSALLNKNSINFLNNGTNNISQKSKKTLINYFKDSNENVCLTSSIILELFGLRDANDVDYITKNKQIKGNNIGEHNGIWLTYYPYTKEEIIDNPNFHFYFNGSKVISLDILKQMKEKRNEIKDQRDIQLINNLNQFLPIYVINLKKRIDRREYIEHHFKSINLKNYQFFEGVEPSMKMVLNWNKNYINESTNQTEDYKKGCLGCLLSHYHIMKEALNNNYKNVLILEDDINFKIPDINILFDFIKDKKYDMLYFSGSHFKKGSVNGNLMKIIDTRTTGSYIITKKVMEYIVKDIENYPKEIDTYYAEEIQPKFDCYCIIPHITTQMPGFSDIQNKFVNYQLSDNI